MDSLRSFREDDAKTILKAAQVRRILLRRNMFNDRNSFWASQKLKTPILKVLAVKASFNLFKWRIALNMPRFLPPPPNVSCN